MLVKVELLNGKTKEFQGEFIWEWQDDDQNISAGGGFLGGGGSAIGIRKDLSSRSRWLDLRIVDEENSWGKVVWQGYAMSIEVERN